MFNKKLKNKHLKLHKQKTIGDQNIPNFAFLNVAKNISNTLLKDTLKYIDAQHLRI